MYELLLLDKTKGLRVNSFTVILIMLNNFSKLFIFCISVVDIDEIGPNEMLLLDKYKERSNKHCLLTFLFLCVSTLAFNSISY